MLNRAESIGEAAPLNSIGSSVVISDKSVTEFTHSNITTPHRDKTGIPRVEYQIKSIQEAPSQASITLVKEEPIDLTSLDFDEELMSVSETKVSKAVRHADSTRAAKPEASKVVDEELQELEELQKLREEKEKLQRDIELLEKKRKMDEITKKIEDAEARAKRIKTE
ncbi:uncharacterized protein Bfra_007605 [Botrytis fragariae]|uniref:Uncharacterized protein n=1 Tax=Botrytis fragariae TaxID=1964551 RepID=A0A8H6AP89_9HELO|nr:uncharacterized protein Bfra_007605 [Botrytis fragariae]KAF5871092.1 hypothetical protein Bfra_007605 [Botrytis fragariae]